MSSPPTLDPVCGRPVDPLRARAVGIFGGTTYYFCSFDCKARYADPRGAPAHVEVSQASRAQAAPQRAQAAPQVDALSVERRAPEPGERGAPVSEFSPDGDGAHPEAKRSGVPVVLGAVLVVGVLLAIWATVASRHDGAPPVAKAPAVVLVPSERVRPVVDPPPPPVVPTYPDLVAPLKLGMRRFVGGEPPTAFVQLLVIDGNDHATPIRIAELTAADPAASGTSEAVAPEPAFQSATSAQGAIFSTRLMSGVSTIDVRVVRQADAVVAETSTTAGAWHAAARIPLLADAQLRAAAFAKKRYVTEEKP